MREKPIVVNLIAGSGVGKSTTAAKIFYLLKEKGVEVELVTEYIKDMVWEERKKLLSCQPYIFGKQLYKLVRLEGKVDIIVTDAPILFSAIYDPEDDLIFRRFVLNKFSQFDNLNFYLERLYQFNPNGRNEKTVEEAIKNDLKLYQVLVANGIPFYQMKPSNEGCKEMVEMILNKLEER